MKKANAEETQESIRQAEAGLKIIEEEKSKRKFEKIEEETIVIERQIKTIKKGCGKCGSIKPDWEVSVITIKNTRKL